MNESDSLMLWATLILALALSLAAVVWVIWPLTRQAPAPLLVEDDRLSELLGRKDAVMAAIKDLEFDHKVGKLSEDDFQRYEQRLRRQAIGLIQQIEQLAPESTSLDTSLEAEIRHRRKVHEAPPADVRPTVETAAAPARPQAPAATVPVAAAVAAQAGGAANGAAPRFCTECGGRLEPHHKFCAQCGAPVAQTAAH